MPSIILTDLSFSHTSTPLLDRITMRVGDGERACLVGPNGCGKTTLLRLIAKELIPDEGTVTLEGITDAPPVRVPDALDFRGTVEQFLDEALNHLRCLSDRFDEVSAALADPRCPEALLREYDVLLDRMTAGDVWSLDARTDETLTGLGLPELVGPGRTRGLDTLSPGQRRRLELAATMLAEPPVLLLDEPTAHLDDDGVGFLVGLLQGWIGPVLMVSHDRAFVDEAATVIHDLDIAPWQALASAEGNGKLPGVQRCSGNYSDYLVAKEHARNTHIELHRAQQEEKRSLRAHRDSSRRISLGGTHLATAEGMARKFFADRAAATATRRSRDDDRRLEVLAAREVRKPREHHLRPTLPGVAPRNGIAVAIRSAAITGRLAEVTSDVAHGDHLLVTGTNGAGKSTLLAWIAAGEPPAGTEALAAGSIGRDGKLAIVPQRLPERGDPGLTDQMWRAGIGEVGAGFLHPSMWHTPVDELCPPETSGGHSWRWPWPQARTYWSSMSRPTTWISMRSRRWKRCSSGGTARSSSPVMTVGSWSTGGAHDFTWPPPHHDGEADEPGQAPTHLGHTLARRHDDVLAFFDHHGSSNGPTEAINGRREYLRGAALGFRNLTHYITKSLLEAGGFRPDLHSRL